MSPHLGKTLFTMGMIIIVLLLMSLPFIDRSSPQFVVGSISLVAIAVFTLLVAWDVRRQVRGR